MPLNPPALAAGFITPNLISTGNLGTGVPKFALGLSMGVCQFLTIESKVTTVDAGTLGVGTGIIPLIVPNPLVQSSLVTGFVSVGILGTLAPLFIQGLTTGLCTGWLALALLQTNHPTVGVGAGVARITGPTAVPAMLAGFSAVGMTGIGPTKMAQAIGTALDMVFASFVQPGIPIVGTPSIVGSSGVGFGTVI
jgi:hypothetical protein